MAKRVYNKSEWLGVGRTRPFLEAAPKVVNIYSVSGCISEDFADYFRYWKHNGYWMFDTPETICSVSKENSINLVGMKLFYYEVYEQEFDGRGWKPFSPEPSFKTGVSVPANKHLEGFDVVTFSSGTSPECSPLSCNSMAEELPTNIHCLFDTFEEAERNLNDGAFRDAEPGPYRIFAVYSLEWPD